MDDNEDTACTIFFIFNSLFILFFHLKKFQLKFKQIQNVEDTVSHFEGSRRKGRKGIILLRFMFYAYENHIKLKCLRKSFQQ